MEADLIVDIDDTPPGFTPTEADTLPEGVQPDDGLSSAESLPVLEFPEIEVDAWIDLEDQWEKDYYFTVFTDDELYHHMYALYYPVLKDETVAQHLARQQVASLKATLGRMKAPRDKIPAHLIPLFRGTRASLENDFGNYKAFFEKTKRMPYSEAQHLIRSYFLKSLQAFNSHEPYLQFTERRELELYRGTLDEKDTETEQDGGAAKQTKSAKQTKKPAKKTKKTEETPEPTEEPTKGGYGKNRMVILPTDETPLVIDGVLQADRMPAEALPMLYVKERVEYPAPMIQSQIGLDTLDWKRPSSLQRALQSIQFPLETHVLPTIDTLTSLHALQVQLASYGFALEQLTRSDNAALHAHLSALYAKVKLAKTSRTRFLWESVPVVGYKPSERSPFDRLKPWVESSQAHLKKHAATYQSKLALLEKHSESFSKHPGMAPNLYDLAVRLRAQQIDIEEAIATLQAIHTEAHQQSYVDFLRDLLQAAAVLADDEAGRAAALDAAIDAWNRMDASVEIDRHSITRTYHTDHAFVVGARTFLTEDAVFQEQTLLAEENDDDEAYVEDDHDPAADPEEDANTDVFEPPLVSSTGDEEDPNAPPRGTDGQREIWMYVRRMLRELHQQTELPLPEDACTEFVFQHAPTLQSRASLLETLTQAFPEMPAAELKTLVEQRLYMGPAENEAAVRKVYKEAYGDLKKTVVETFLYALTWWVIYLQDHSIRHGRPFAPTYTACLSVWAFYGTPMSSNDDKGIARYLICVALSLLENDPDHSAWFVLRGIPETKLLDRIYKNAKLDEFDDTVQFLKQQWKERWKEIARKEKDAEIRLEALEKATENPKEYLKLYTHLMVHLPVLLAKSGAQKKDAMVVPVANSCCFQPLSARFQPFADFKDAGLFAHTKTLAARAAKPTRASVGRTGELGRVQLFEPLQPGVNSMTFYTHLQCTQSYSLPEPAEAAATPPRPGVSKGQWNDLCRLLEEPDWALVGDLDAPVGETSVSHIQRATQALVARLTHAKSHIDRWTTWIHTRATWEEKKRLLQFLYAVLKDERILHEWAAPALTTAMSRVAEWIRTVAQWVPGDHPDAPMELLSYVIHRTLFVPETDTVHPKQLQTLISNRFDRVIVRMMKKEIPSQRAIQDYYANVREKLKLGNLEAYKSKSIQEIQELQDAKRLKLSSLLVKPASTPGTTAETEADADADAALEAEGLAEHRVYASWNADEMNPDTLD